MIKNGFIRDEDGYWRPMCDIYSLYVEEELEGWRICVDYEDPANALSTMVIDTFDSKHEAQDSLDEIMEMRIN